MKLLTSQTMNLAIRYGSPKLGGAGFCPLFQEQGVLALELFISNIRSDNQSSKMLRIALSWWQAYCGTSRPLLQYPRDHLPQMQRGWVYTLRNFLAQIDGLLEISNTTTDSTSDYIMDCVDMQPARLNIKADRLAAKHQETTTVSPSRTGTRLTNNTCQLTIKNKVISSHYAQEARHAFSSIPIHRYMLRKFGWTKEIYESVDWTEFQRLTRQFYRHRIIIIKHIWRLAPTGSIASQNDPALPSSCPHCQAPDECNDHLLKCPSEVRQEWRSRMYQKIRETANNHPNANIVATNMLLGGLQQWLEDTPYNTNDLPEQY